MLELVPAKIPTWGIAVGRFSRMDLNNESREKDGENSKEVTEQEKAK